MRKVTAEIRRAFNNGQKKTIGNTWTDGESVYLHGNKIVSRNPVSKVVYICTHGWNTITTRERLNAFTNKRVYQKKHKLMLDNDEWNGDWTAA